MIRIFHIYYPVRQLVLLAGEALIVFTSFLLAVILQYGADSFLVLNFEYGYDKILLVTGFVLLLSHWFDLYDLASWEAKWDQIFRVLLVLGFAGLTLGAAGYVFPRVMLGNAFVLGLFILAVSLMVWRTVYSWLAEQPYLRESVYVLGLGERAQRLVYGLQNRRELGIDVAGWSGNLTGVTSLENIADDLLQQVAARRIHRVIVAMNDRRGTTPMDELLQLRLGGVKIEEATSWLEKISGKIEVENLYPSWLIFSQGFRFNAALAVGRRIFSLLVSALLLTMLLPLVPLVMLLIKLDSPGPILYRQKRVGLGGAVFNCYKFRTMRQDAEADTGPTWAGDDDPRITRSGHWLRASRLDEIPQLWCVFKGDMAFVGPRPERPEFVRWLTEAIPYYPVRHVVRPGITGWAQVRYKYGNTIEDAKEKLQYDLYYIKNASLGLDFVIMFQTIKTVLLGRGAQ